MVKMRLHKKQGKLAIAGLFVTWVPLVIITAIEGTLYTGTQLPFLYDVGMQSRVLVAFPMLIMIKVVIDSKVFLVAKYISEALITGEERQIILASALHRAKQLTNSAIAEITILFIVIVATVSLVKGSAFSALNTGTTSWMTSSGQENNGLSIAGYWAVIISIPLFQFLLFRWLWRYFVWILLLFRLSKAPLNLLPTHADRAGGLGIIMMAQRSFNLIFVACAVVLSGQFIQQLIEHPDAYNTIRSESIAFMVLSIVFILIPLFFFTGKLLKTKNKGLLHLSNLGATLSRKFEKEWISDLPNEDRIEEKQVDPSMLYDYSGLYEQIQKFRTVPVTIHDIVGLAIILFVPFIPILFIHFSIGELLQKIAGLLV